MPVYDLEVWKSHILLKSTQKSQFTITPDFALK